METPVHQTLKAATPNEDLLASGRGELLVKKARNFQHQPC